MPGVSQMDLNSHQSDMMVQSQPGFNADTINTLIVSILHEESKPETSQNVDSGDTHDDCKLHCCIHTCIVLYQLFSRYILILNRYVYMCISVLLS